MIGRTLAAYQRQQFAAQDCPSRQTSLELGERVPLEERHFPPEDRLLPELLKCFKKNATKSIAANAEM